MEEEETVNTLNAGHRLMPGPCVFDAFCDDHEVTRSRFTEDQIIGILKEHEAGVSIAGLCRKQGVSDSTLCKGKARYGAMDVSEAKRLKGPEVEVDQETIRGIVFPTNGMPV